MQVRMIRWLRYLAIVVFGLATGIPVAAFLFGDLGFSTALAILGALLFLAALLFQIAESLQTVSDYRSDRLTSRSGAPQIRVSSVDGSIRPFVFPFDGGPESFNTFARARELELVDSGLVVDAVVDPEEGDRILTTDSADEELDRLAQTELEK